MSPWSQFPEGAGHPPTQGPSGWQGGFQPWGSISAQDAEKMRMSLYGGPSSFPTPGFSPTGPSTFQGSGASAFSPPLAVNPFSRPSSFSGHPREHFLQRPIQPGFDRPGHGFDQLSPELPSASSTPGSPSKDTSSRSPFSSHSPRSGYSSSSSVSPRGGTGSTLITRAEPEPGELTIEKSEPWAPSPGPSWAPPPPRHPPTRSSHDQSTSQTR